MSAPLKSFVINRHGERVKVRFDEITNRIENLAMNAYYGNELTNIDPPAITQSVITRFRSGMTTLEIEELTIDICREHSTENEEYQLLASRIAITGLIHKSSPPCIKNCVIELVLNGCTQFADEYVGIINKHFGEINRHINHRRDFNLKYFGFSTILRYLITTPDKLLRERPQHMYMRVALSLFYKGKDSLPKVFEFYDLLSIQKVSVASPIMLNSGTKNQQRSSCFLIGIGDDIGSIFDTLKATGMISKRAGGIGLWASAIRAEGSLIKSTGGKSKGLRSFIRLFHECQLAIDQGGLRPGAFAIYLEPWHADIFTFLVDLPRLKNDPTTSAPNLKYALWIPDNFMRALVEKKPWYLMSPDECPGLYSTWGEEYEALYDSYVEKGLRNELRIFKQVDPVDIMTEAFKTMREVGTPYISFKDNVNRLSNMQNVATIASSNLCNEITIPSWSAIDAEAFGQEPGQGEIGVCNLGAVCLGSFVIDGEDGPTVDYKAIVNAAQYLAEALDNIIDTNDYPTPEAERSNKRHRPLGIGIIGLADVFAQMKLVFGSEEAQQVDSAIASAIYYGALKKSAEIAKINGPYPSFHFNGGCPASKGLLQPDLWVKNNYLETGWEDKLAKLTGITKDDWSSLRGEVMQGIRNAYLTAYMPTASTSNIVGQNEAFEPFTSNIYVRNTLSGEFVMVNKYLLKELEGLGLWTESIQRKLMNARGSVQSLNIPDDLKKRFKIAQEIDQRLIVKHSIARGPFVCQTQSMNFFYAKPTLKQIFTTMVMAWRAGLKTGSYYIHSEEGVMAFKSALKDLKNIDEAIEEKSKDVETAKAIPLVCRLGPGGPDCAACAL